MPFPGGAEGALEFAAFEKGLLERGRGPVRDQTPPHASEPGVGRERQAPISEPHRPSVHWGWMLAGAGTAVAAGAVFLLLGSGLLSSGFATALRVVALH